MKPEQGVARIVSVLAEAGWNISQQQEKQMVDYVFIVQEWNRKINLVSRSAKTDLVINHLLPSVLYAVFLRKEISEEETRVVDLGSGGGFPGIVLSILLEPVVVTMVDAVRKKTLFLIRVVRDLHLNAEVLHTRVEEISSNQNTFPFAVARGFTNLSDLIYHTAPLLRKDGILFTLKGEDYLMELPNPRPQGVVIHELKIDKKWLELAPNLAHKRMIKVEF